MMSEIFGKNGNGSNNVHLMIKMFVFLEKKLIFNCRSTKVTTYRYGEKTSHFCDVIEEVSNGLLFVTVSLN